MPATIESPDGCQKKESPPLAAMSGGRGCGKTKKAKGNPLTKKTSSEHQQGRRMLPEASCRILSADLTKQKSTGKIQPLFMDYGKKNRVRETRMVQWAAGGG